MPTFIDGLMQALGAFQQPTNQVAAQTAQSLGSDNPMQAYFQNLKGLPHPDIIGSAANWDLNNQNNQLARDNFNLNVKNQEDALQQRTAQGSMLQGLWGKLSEQDRAALQNTPEGRFQLVYGDAMAGSPTVFDPAQLGSVYGGVGRTLQGNYDKQLATDAASNSLQQRTAVLQNAINSLPDGANKGLLSAMIPMAGDDKTYNMMMETIQAISKPADPYRQAALEETIKHNRITENQGQQRIDNGLNPASKTKKLSSTDAYNQVSALVDYYKSPNDFKADLERNKAKLIAKFGLSKYNQLVEEATMADPKAGSLFRPGSGSPMRYYLTNTQSYW